MATIYAAIDMTTKARVAVKVLHPEHDQDVLLVRRFVQEGQIAAQIRHPNLVPSYDLGWVGGRRFIVLELVDGKSLNARIKDRPLPWAQSVPLLLDVLAGLAALHARGVAHRDISTNNCMIEVRDGVERAYLLDLGYARVIEDRGLVLTPPDASVSKIIYGSEGFIAPERLHGSPGDYRADVFSVGALWCSMLTGMAPPDPMDADPCSALDKVPLPPRLRAVLRGALDVRDRRHHSAASMAVALRAAMKAIAAGQHRKQRAWWLAPGIGALIFPTWLAVRSGSPTMVCPPAAMPGQTIAAPPVGVPRSNGSRAEQHRADPRSNGSRTEQHRRRPDARRGAAARAPSNTAAGRPDARAHGATARAPSNTAAGPRSNSSRAEQHRRRPAEQQLARRATPPPARRRGDPPRGAEGRESPFARGLRRVYAPALAPLLARPRLAMATVTVLLAGTAASVPWLGEDFLPEFKEHDMP